MDLLMSIVVVALAVWEIIEIWNHSALMAPLRARLEACEDTFFVRLLRCPFCLSPWVSVAVLVLAGMPVIRVLVYALAVARLANLGNDLTKKWCLTPREDELLPVEPPVESGENQQDLHP